ncbi:hypothetical protein AGMMS49546_35220 [Spirochaetia bacterium]|nr:hypothetical protein AGMMS49546_35220 [Spirochaetia bacterium]
MFYAELVTAAGVKLNARSTGKSTRDEALLVVAEWLKDGLPVVKQSGCLAGILSAIKRPSWKGMTPLLLWQRSGQKGGMEVQGGRRGPL